MDNIFSYTEGDNYDFVAVFVWQVDQALPDAGRTGWFNHYFRILEARLVVRGKIIHDAVQVYTGDSVSRGGKNKWTDAIKDAEKYKRNWGRELRKHG
jgi:hypothetical protein